MNNVRPAPVWLAPPVVRALTENWSEMDFVTMLAPAHALYDGLTRLERDPVLGVHFNRANHGENASIHALLAGDGDVDPADRRDHAMQAIAYLARLIEMIDVAAQGAAEGAVQ